MGSRTQNAPKTQFRHLLGAGLVFGGTIFVISTHFSFIGVVLGGIVLAAGLFRLFRSDGLPQATAPSQDRKTTASRTSVPQKIEPRPKAFGKCPSCQKQISTSAVSCPGCGHPLGRRLITMRSRFELRRV
ncbi:zinc-ribbon domain-containing protein [Jiella sonneratiae]|uniref:Zinc-ribbon domain-containing protein n=1 Tax=Jiella sonneratiae TaxID=2816856 RepID=A0ABS3JD95_9HYPH|nr:zinc-ribbon domain-containing protein [Jiella sonneratiae]